jgi:tetratricopeptide (TPR) repeat protein
LRNLFESTGCIEHINRAVGMLEHDISQTPDATSLANCFEHLQGAPQSRFKTGSIDDINQAIKIQENLLAATPPGNPNHASSLHNLGILLQDRYKRNASLIDINRAISLSNRGMYLDNLVGAIERLSELEGSLDELDTAIEIIKQAVSSTPAHNANHITYVNSLGESLYNRFQKIESMDGLNLAIIQYT